MLFRKMLRTIGRYKSQFISMIIMIAIGVGMFLGFNMEWYSLDTDTSSFFEQTGFADYRIVSKDGFSSEDLKKVSSIDGVRHASRYFSVNADVDGTKNMLGLTVTENPRVSGFTVTDGQEYDQNSENGIWLFDKYADANGVKLGDTISLTYESLKLSGVVKGLIESGEYMICVRDETQLMPDFKLYGYAYVTPRMLRQAMESSVSSELRSNMGALIPEDFFGDLADGYAQSQAEESYKTVYPQINLISELPKAELTKEVEKRLNKTLLILGKDENVSYSESQGEVDEGKTMGSVLPALFLLIAVLTMVSTMHRLAVNEKTQIGTLKALGFKDRRILMHYTSYAAGIGIFGTALGIGLGYLVAWVIMNPGGMMGTYIVMTDWTIRLPLWCWPVLLAIILFLTLIGFLSTRQMLAGTAADALRPYTPKKMKRAAIERIRQLDRLGFGAKWNLRDILRHKSRSFMTFFGVWGCAVLIVAALGMNDTVGSFISMYYEDVADYSTKIFIADDSDNTEAIKTADKYKGDYCASISVQIEDAPVSLDVYGIRHNTINFLDENNMKISLPKDGALVCIRLRDEYNLKQGDFIKLSPYGSSESYNVRVEGFNRSMSKSVSVSEEYAKTLKSGSVLLTDSDAYIINTVYSRSEKSEISGGAVSSVQSKQDIIDSMDSFMELMYTFVIILIAGAALLGVIVLYNLGVMSFTERYREMATLKVVGFKDRKIGSLLISQNIWLSALGIIVGVPSGYAVLSLLIKLLASEYEMTVSVTVSAIAISVLLTLGVSLLMGFIIARKNRKIEMVSALKIPE